MLKNLTLNSLHQLIYDLIIVLGNQRRFNNSSIILYIFQSNCGSTVQKNIQGTYGYIS